jgi:hypothetical protein
MWLESRDESVHSIPVIVISARDPMGEPMLGYTLSVSQSGGFTVSNLMDCLKLLSDELSPLAKSGK